MDESLALLLAGTLAFTFGWNNSSILIGNDRGSGSISGRGSIILCSIGMLLGVAIEGSKTDGTFGRLVAGQVTDAVIIATLVVSIVFTLGLTVSALPVSFSNTIVGAFTGAAVASSLQVRTGNLATIVVFWGIAPLATMAVTFLTYRVIESAIRRSSLLAVDSFNRAGVSVVSLTLAYVLGANNIGLIYGTVASAPGAPAPVSYSLIAVLAAIAIIAMVLFGRGNVAGTVGDRLLSLSPQGVLAAFSGSIIVMYAATQLGIPISMSQCLVGGMFGSALSRRIAIINQRLSVEVVASWVVVPLAAFALSAVLVPLV